MLYQRGNIVLQRMLNADFTSIKDPVHGYIQLPKLIADKFIDTDLFQRLQEVSQTGMKVLYPNATHNRFCHSLGVYHLGRKSFDCFRHNVQSQYPYIYESVRELSPLVEDFSCSPKDCIFSSESITPDQLWDKWGLLFQLACLLHDCGHSPFSHSLESVYDVCLSKYTHNSNPSDSPSCFSNYFLTTILGKDSAFSTGLITDKDRGKAYGAPHERMSCCMMIKEYHHAILDVLQSASFYQKLESTNKYRKDYEECLVALKEIDAINENTIATAIGTHIFKKDLEFMVRCIIGYPYKCDCSDRNVSITLQIKNCIIQLLNSKLDVDNLDYTVRDSETSGYSSAAVDIERLLRSRTITVGNDLYQYTIRNQKVDHEFCLKSLTVGPNDGEFDAYISGPIRFQRNSGDGTLKVTIDDKNIHQEVNQKFFVLDENQRAHIYSKGASFCITPRKSDSIAAVHICKTISGCFTGKAFGGLNKDGNNLSFVSEQKPLLIESAFHKSALSVLQGAYDANNFESLWIYSHHKTTYYNSFLVFCLLDTYCGILYEREKKNFGLLIKGMKPLQGFDIAPLPSNICQHTLVQKAQNLYEIGNHNFNHKYFLWDDMDLQEIKAAAEHANDLSPERYQQAYAILTAAITARLSESADFAKEAYSKLKKLFLAAVTPQEKIQPSDIDWISQINAFEKISGDVLEVMFNVIGMTQKTRYDGKEFYRSSDFDLIGRYKEMLRELQAKTTLTTREKRFKEVAQQFMGRHYGKSLWKSHAEYAYYAQKHSSSQLDTLWKELNKIANRYTPDAQNSSAPAQYVFFADYETNNLPDLWSSFKEHFGSAIEVLVWVPQKIKHKSYNLRQTYITWQTRTVSLAELNFHQGADNGVAFFYIFYKIKEGEHLALDAEDVIDWLVEYFSKAKHL